MKWPQHDWHRSELKPLGHALYIAGERPHPVRCRRCDGVWPSEQPKDVCPGLDPRDAA